MDTQSRVQFHTYLLNFCLFNQVNHDIVFLCLSVNGRFAYALTEIFCFPSAAPSPMGSESDCIV